MTDSYDMLRNARDPAQFCAVLERLAMELVETEVEDEITANTPEEVEEWRAIAADLNAIAGNFGNGRVTSDFPAKRHVGGSEAAANEAPDPDAWTEIKHLRALNADLVEAHQLVLPYIKDHLLRHPHDDEPWALECAVAVIHAAIADFAWIESNPRRCAECGATGCCYECARQGGPGADLLLADPRA
jgi:hypothetical protein